MRRPRLCLRLRARQSETLGALLGSYPRDPLSGSTIQWMAQRGMTWLEFRRVFALISPRKNRVYGRLAADHVWPRRLTMSLAIRPPRSETYVVYGRYTRPSVADLERFWQKNGRQSFESLAVM